MIAEKVMMSREGTVGQVLQGEGQRVLKRYGSFKKVTFIIGKNLAFGYSSAAGTVFAISYKQCHRPQSELSAS